MPGTVLYLGVHKLADHVSSQLPTSRQDILDNDKLIALVKTSIEALSPVVQAIQKDGPEQLLTFDADRLATDLANAKQTMDQAGSMPQLPEEVSEAGQLREQLAVVVGAAKAQQVVFESKVVSMYNANSFWENITEADQTTLANTSKVFKILYAAGTKELKGQSSVLACVHLLASKNIHATCNRITTFSDAKASLELLAIQGYKELRANLKLFQPAEGDSAV